MKTAKVLSTHRLSISLQGRSILNDLSLSLEPESFVVLFGPNGTGKTTLLRTLAGIQKAGSGSITVFGQDISSLSRKELSRRICYIPQRHYPVFAYSVLDFVLMGRTVHTPFLRTPTKEDYHFTMDVLEKLGIGHLAQRSYLQLSEGERQMILLARGLVQDSPILLLDEPVSNLDFKNQHQILQCIAKLIKEQKKTALISLHDPNQAMDFGDEIVVLFQRTHYATLSKKDSTFPEQMEKVLQTIYNPDIRICQIGARPVALNAASF